MVREASGGTGKLQRAIEVQLPVSKSLAHPEADLMSNLRSFEEAFKKHHLRAFSKRKDLVELPESLALSLQRDQAREMVGRTSSFLAADGRMWQAKGRDERVGGRVHGASFELYEHVRVYLYDPLCMYAFACMQDLCMHKNLNACLYD